MPTYNSIGLRGNIPKILQNIVIEKEDNEKYLCNIIKILGIDRFLICANYPLCGYSLIFETIKHNKINMYKFLINCGIDTKMHTVKGNSICDMIMKIFENDEITKKKYLEIYSRKFENNSRILNTLRYRINY